MFVDHFVVMVLLFIKQKSACANDRRNNAHYCHVTLLTRWPESVKTKLHCLEISPRAALLYCSFCQWRPSPRLLPRSTRQSLLFAMATESLFKYMSAVSVTEVFQRPRRFCLLGRNTMKCVETHPTFRRNMSPPSPESKTNRQTRATAFLPTLKMEAECPSETYVYFQEDGAMMDYGFPL
jgi:hypothetical protein